MRNILLTCAENTDFNTLFKTLENFPYIITFDNCGGSFNSILAEIFRWFADKKIIAKFKKFLQNLFDYS